MEGECVLHHTLIAGLGRRASNGQALLGAPDPEAEGPHPLRAAGRMGLNIFRKESQSE